MDHRSETKALTHRLPGRFQSTGACRTYVLVTRGNGCSNSGKYIFIFI